MRLQRDATTRAARTSTRPRAAASTPRFARICLSTRSRRPARRVSPRLVPPQRPRRRVLVPRCPPFPSDDDPPPPFRPRRARNSRDAPTIARAPSSSSPSVSSWTTACSSPRARSSARAAFASPRRTPRTTSTSRASSASGPPFANPPPDAARNSRAPRAKTGEDAPPPRAPPRRGDRAPPPARNEEPRASPPSETRRASPSVVVATRRTPNAASRRMPNAASPPLPRAMGRIPRTRGSTSPRVTLCFENTPPGRARGRVPRAGRR